MQPKALHVLSELLPGIGVGGCGGLSCRAGSDVPHSAQRGLGGQYVRGSAPLFPLRPSPAHPPLSQAWHGMQLFAPQGTRKHCGRVAGNIQPAATCCRADARRDLSKSADSSASIEYVYMSEPLLGQVASGSISGARRSRGLCPGLLATEGWFSDRMHRHSNAC